MDFAEKNIAFKSEMGIYRFLSPLNSDSHFWNVIETRTIVFIFSAMFSGKLFFPLRRMRFYRE